MATVNFRQANIEAAKAVSASGATRSAAEGVLSRARALTAAHTDTGEYASHLKLFSQTGKYGVTDWVVANDWKYAAPLEFGHKNRDGGFTAGRFVLTQAAK